MIPLVVMTVALAAFRALGTLRYDSLDSWAVALRYALAVMFLFTGTMHFTRTRSAFVRMVPPWIPRPALAVALTGVFELAGAIGLLVPGWDRIAAYALIALLVAMLPANVYAAREGLKIEGRLATPLPLRIPLQLFWIGALWWCVQDPPLTRFGEPGGPEMVTTDVAHFVAAYARLAPTDTTCAALDDYFRQASPGLLSYRRKFTVGPLELCRAVRRDPARYAGVQSIAPMLDSIGEPVRAVYARLGSLAPEVQFPSVYFVVGTGISAGNKTYGAEPKILMGAEFIRSVEGLPMAIAHELAHAAQRYPGWKLIGTGPSWIRGSLLAQCIKEGSANFIAEVAVGRMLPPRSHAWADAHEGELWREFQRDMHGTDYSRWIYNGGDRTRSGDRPADLGYYMGYRITWAYYQHARDKGQAIRDILTIDDFERFARESGYAPGSVP